MTDHAPATGQLAPDAAARDAAKRELSGEADSVIRGEGIEFVTRGVEDWQRAAVLGVISAAREEETHRARRVKRQDREPWSRSQRSPQGFDDRR